MAKVLIAGGGLAGLAAAAALGGAGFEVEVFEARPFLGGRATSYPLPAANGAAPEVIDNCQHILMRCCINLLDFYRRLGVRDRIRFYREFYFLEPGGRISVLRRGRLPAPFHFTGSFLRMHCLDRRDKLGVARALLAMRLERTRRKDLDRIGMLDWLLEKRQTPRAIDRLWRQILVSAVNEDLEHMAAIHGFQVFSLGFFARADSYEMGVPSIPLAQLYSGDSWSRLPNVRFHFRSPVERVDAAGFVVAGERRVAGHYICALPFERLESVGLPAPRLGHSPITGVHLWFDREVTTLPHATLLDRTMQWMLLVVVLVAFQVHVAVVAGQAAAHQQRRHDPQPLQCPAVPRVLVGNGGRGGFHHGEGSPGPENQLEIPGHQVQVALAAHLAPQQENGDQRDQELRGVGEAQDGHWCRTFILRYP
jgi:squalene-associated FAD-dependent desaturase